MVARLSASATPIPLHPRASGAHTLPRYPSPLIGRDDLIAGVRPVLLDPDVRLLTLTGPAGTGKTRLALALAESVLDEFPDGVWFVGLEAVHDPVSVVPTIAQALAIPETATESPRVELTSYLSQRTALLVLDNFEHILTAAPQIGALLQSCPRLTVLVTSRAALHLRWEHERPVPALAVPQAAAHQSAAAIAGSPAVALFVERAQAVQPDFRLTDANAAAVASICAHLDGLPLSIELAAARIRLLTPQALRDRLHHPLSLLTHGASDLPARHQTLRAALEWSHDLLTPEEQTVFRRLAVFAAGWSVEAAEAVAGPTGSDRDPAAVLDILDALLNHNLLRREETAGEIRLHMLESVREFAAERLAAAGEQREIERRHTAWILALAEQAETSLRGPEQGMWLARLEADHASVRTVFERASARGDADTMLRLCGSLWRSWEMRGHYREGQRWLDQALASGAGAPATLRAKALNGAGCLAMNQGDYPRATDLLEQSLHLRQELADESGIATALNNLALVAVAQSDLTRGRALHEESLAVLRSLGDPRRIGQSLNNLALVLHQQGDDAQATALLEESLAIARDLDDTWNIAARLGNLAEVARQQGALERATALLTESTMLFRVLGDQRRLAECLVEFAALAAAQGHAKRAVTLAGAADALLEALGTPAQPTERAANEAVIAIARSALGEADFLSAWTEGRTASLDQSLALALAPVHADRPDLHSVGTHDPALNKGKRGLPDHLTAREVEVLALIAEGIGNQSIADRLVISLRTVEHHIASIYRKIGARGRADAVSYALRHGLA